MDFTFQNGIQTIKTWITKIFNIADYNKFCGRNNAEKLVLFDQNWFISYNRMLLLYDWVSVSYYTLEHLVSSLKKKWLLYDYLSTSCFFPSSCSCTLIVKKSYRNVFLRKKKKNERGLSFSLDKVQFRKCKQKNSFEWYIFHFHHWYSWQLGEGEKKKTWAVRQISKNTYAAI